MTAPHTSGYGAVMVNGKQKADNRDMVLQSLKDIEPCDQQIIDLLLLLLDDWEIRAAVMRSISARKQDAQQLIQVAKSS